MRGEALRSAYALLDVLLDVTDTCTIPVGEPHGLTLTSIGVAGLAVHSVERTTESLLYGSEKKSATVNPPTISDGRTKPMALKGTAENPFRVLECESDDDDKSVDELRSTLRSVDDAPKPATKTLSDDSDGGLSEESVEPVVDKMYTLRCGTQSIQTHSVSASTVGLFQHHAALSHVTFYGRCFRCQNVSHSQKYCPLSQCSACGEYGHTSQVCSDVHASRVEGVQARPRARFVKRAPTDSWRKIPRKIPSDANWVGLAPPTKISLCDDEMLHVKVTDFPVADLVDVKERPSEMNPNRE